MNKFFEGFEKQAGFRDTLNKLFRDGVQHKHNVSGGLKHDPGPETMKVLHNLKKNFGLKLFGGGAILGGGVATGKNIADRLTKKKER